MALSKKVLALVAYLCLSGTALAIRELRSESDAAGAAALPEPGNLTLSLAASSLPDPSIYGAFEVIGNTSVVGTQLAAVPGTDGFFLAERPSSRHPDRSNVNAAVFDVVTRTNTHVYCATSLENCAQSFLPNGSVMILAGHKPQGRFPEGRKGVRVLDMSAKPIAALVDVGQLQYGHWLATATVLGDSKIVVMSDSPSPVNPPKAKGGAKGLGNPFYELWDPAKPASTKTFQLSSNFIKNTKYFYYPFNFLLPTGDLFVWANQYGEVINPSNGKTQVVLPDWKDKAAHMMTQYPFSGSAVMLPLTPENNYTAEVVVFGGQWDYGWINTTAVDLSMRLKIGVSDRGYKVGQWEMEKMPSPRVSHSAVLLPNGAVLLMGGAKRGLLGDSAQGGAAMLNDPNFWVAMYNASAPEGRRYTTLARSQIARLLHSAVGLTTNGTVFVTGCDRCDRFWSAVEYSPSPTSFPEYRSEIYSPPFVFDSAHIPVITDWPETIHYGETVGVGYDIPTDGAEVTSAVLVAPSSDTHTFNMHQRVIGLKIMGLNTDTNHNVFKTVMLQGPPDANVAPPGKYMLFLLHGNTYSQAKWVTITGDEKIEL